MSGKILSLSRARKDRARAARRTGAEANAARHGRTKAERAAEAATAEKARRDLDGHARDPGRDGSCRDGGDASPDPSPNPGRE